MYGFLSNNPRLIREIILLAVIMGVYTLAAWLSLGWIAGLVCIGLSVIAVICFSAISYRRYREIRKLGDEISQILDHGRRIDFSAYEEGDLAILENQLSKLVDRLALTTRLLADEKTALADSLADISHQIRTPLTTAMLIIPDIECDPDEESRKRKCRSLEMLLDRVSWLITNLLKMAKLDNGTMRMDEREVLLTDVVSRAMEPLELLFDLRGIETELVIEDDATFVGDAKWTAEALQNILKNAAENLETGNHLKVEGFEDALATRLIIIDDGHGIDAADLPHVFERFYRGKGKPSVHGNTDSNIQEGRHASNTSYDHGKALENFGIGLALAQSLVSAQGGTIRASDSKSGGARFDITFPKKP